MSDKGATFVWLERFNDVVALFDKALQVSVASNSKRTQMVTHEELGQLYEKMGNSHLALANYKESHRLDRETRAESAQQAMAEFEVLLENEKQRALISEQQLKIEQSRVATLRIIAVSIFDSLVLIVFFIYNYHARRAEKLESNLMNDLIERKRGLFSDISHELPTLIAVLKLQIEGLEHHLIEEPEMTYKILHQKLASIDHLLSDISQLAMVDSGALKLNFENVELSTFFQDWYETVKVLPEQAGLQFVMQSDLATGTRIWMDPFRILQVLNNLPTNSVRYTDSPGRIEMSISIEQQQLYITLADTAPGLPDKQLALIFDRLFRAEASRDRHTGGSGLGLTICRGFIEAHRSSINAAQSELGRICINIALPINESGEA